MTTIGNLSTPSGPATLTILPTYRCTAACEQCCFGSNPKLRERLSREEIFDAIEQANTAFTTLRQVVFSRGECVMLGEDLYAGIAHANALGLATRIVTNGYWGSSVNKAAKVAAKLAESGLKEVNISTGRDHAEFIPIESVLTAASAAIEYGIFVLITAEQDAADSDVIAAITSHPRFSSLDQLGHEKFRFQINTWMKFTDEHADRPLHQKAPKMEPCHQIFSNIVVTPHRNIAACCGLTFEHIPEMRLGSLDDPSAIAAAYAKETSDFLKIWIHLDGPDRIVQKLYGNEPPKDLISKDHMCETCVRMHKCDTTRELIRTRYIEFYPEVMLRYTMKRFIETSVMK